MVFDEEKYAEFIEMEITQKNLDFYEEKYLSNNLKFNSIELEFEFLYSLSKHFIDFFSMETNRIQNALFLKKDEFYKPIFYTLKAIDVLNSNVLNCPIDEYIKRAYVNLGNYFANQYRIYEALECYNKALHFDLYFDMANANRLLAFEKIECLNYYVDNQKLFYYLANEYSILDTKNMEAGNEFFSLKKIHYMKALKARINKFKNGKSKNPLQQFTILIDCELSDTYNEWCLKNGLYLNPLNDIELAVEAANDIFVDAGLDLDNKKMSLLKRLFNDYIYCREKVYAKKSVSSDNEIRELCSTFKELFSIFDKIAYFLFLFFDLDFKDKDVTYLRVFDLNTKLKNGTYLLDIHNTNLYSLFWIKREYRMSNDKLNMHQYLNKETKYLNDIRTKLEHRTSLLEKEEIDVLFDKTVGLLKIVRRALLYLNALVYEESNPALYSNGKRNTNLVYLPLVNGENLFKE